MPEVVNDVLGTFLGALLGVLGGLAVIHAWQWYTDRDRQGQLLAALKQTVVHNEYLVEQVEGWLVKDGFPFFNVDTTLLESTASLKYELLDIELCRLLDHLRFELDHLGRKVDLLLKLEFDPIARMATSGPGGATSVYQTSGRLSTRPSANISFPFERPRRN